MRSVRIRVVDVDSDYHDVEQRALAFDPFIHRETDPDAVRPRTSAERQVRLEVNAAGLRDTLRFALDRVNQLKRR